jgi:hypothetical protein
MGFGVYKLRVGCPDNNSSNSRKSIVNNSFAYAQIDLWINEYKIALPTNKKT